MTTKKLALVLALALSASACASLTPAVNTIAPPNPNLQIEGRVAQVGIRIVDAIRIAQAGVPTLVRTQVLTPEEGLKVLEGFRSMLEIAGQLGQALKMVDGARDLAEAAKQWDTVTAKVSELLRSGFSLGNDVAGGAGRVAVSGLLGGLGDRLSELMGMSPARSGGVQ